MVNPSEAGCAFHHGVATLYILRNSSKEDTLRAFDAIRSYIEAFINDKLADSTPFPPLPELPKLSNIHDHI